jgi:hypothetical protein
MKSQASNSQNLIVKPLAPAVLPSWFYHGTIILGLLIGMLACCLGGWFYLLEDHKVSGRSIWEDNASQFVVPVCAIVGATFGGIAGVGAVAGFTAFRRTRYKTEIIPSNDS